MRMSRLSNSSMLVHRLAQAAAPAVAAALMQLDAVRGSCAVKVLCLAGPVAGAAAYPKGSARLR